MMNLLSGVKPLNVLLLENDPADAELCLRELRKGGFNLRSDVIPSVEKFRLKVDEGNYDVILADYNLGGATGLDAFEYLKEKGLQIPFILVTGAVGDEFAVECMKRGISDYVLKEHLARLPVAVQHALEEKALRRERTQAETMLRENERRFGLERMKDEFISVVSHELRTPLTAIRGALGLLASGKLCLSPGGCQAMIGVSVSSADRLVRLVNDILDLERIESGHVKLEKKACASASLMTQAADSMRVVAEAQGISLSVIPSSAVLSVDPDRITQVMTNLIDNALKFSPHSSVIRLSAETRDAEVVFRIEDEGRGIPGNKLTSVFEKFQQVDASDSREKGGTGLGLAICRSIVAQHGGRIWVESTLGQGTIFSFALPRGDTAPGSHLEVTESASESLDH